MRYAILLLAVAVLASWAAAQNTPAGPSTRPAGGTATPPSGLAAPADKQVLFAKPFSAEMMKAWTTVMGEWSVVEEDQKAYLHADPGGTRVVVGEKAWTDYAVEVKGRVDKWTQENLGDYGIIVRYVDPNNYYLFLYDHNPKVKAWIIQKKVGGKLITIGQQAGEYELGRWYTLRGVVTGDALEFYVDGKKMATATATEHQAGPAGLLVWLADARLDGFAVTAAAAQP